LITTKTISDDDRSVLVGEKMNYKKQKEKNQIETCGDCEKLAPFLR
jgi:hypothetical protein